MPLRNATPTLVVAALLILVAGEVHGQLQPRPVRAHAGGGLIFAQPVGEFGARYNTNGRVEYLRRGDIIDHPDGSITLEPQRSQADLVTFVLGVSVGVRW